MARLIGPDSGDRATVRPGGAGYARSAPVVVYAASSGSTLANILTEDGDAVAGSTLTTDDFGLIPLFQFPDGVDTVYVEVDGGPRTAVYARYDDRVDSLAARVAELESNPGGSTVTVDGDGTVVVDGTTVELATDEDVVAAAAAAVNLAKGLPLGLTGAAQPTRYVGKWTQTGAPTSGTFAVGDFGFDVTGDIYVCTTAGTPGTWRSHGTGTYAPLAPAWVTGRAYVLNELVLSSGTLYRVSTAHTSSGSFDATKFTAVGGAGGSSESVNTVTSSGSAVTIPDVTTATINDVKLTAATVTFTFPTAAAGKSFTLLVRQDTTGGRLASWPATVKWDANVAPTLTTGAVKYDILAFTCVDGTNWEGVVVGQNRGTTPTLVTDTFTRADAAVLGTADTGQTWVGTSVGITSNKAAVKGAGVSYIEAGVSDCTVQATFAVNGSQCRLVFRYTDANNHWQVQGGAGGGYTLYKKVGGTYTNMGSIASGAANNDVITVVLLGTSIVVKQNGSTIISSLIDTSHQTATKYGFDSAGDTTIRFDDFSVTA